MSSTYEMVSRRPDRPRRRAGRPRIAAVPRSVPVVPAVLFALPPTGCEGGVPGPRGGSGVHAPSSPGAGNGGSDVAHSALSLAYAPAGGHRLTGTATITARAT